MNGNFRTTKTNHLIAFQITQASNPGGDSMRALLFVNDISSVRERSKVTNDCLISMRSGDQFHVEESYDLVLKRIQRGFAIADE